MLTRLTTTQPANQKPVSSKVRYWTGYGYMNSSDGLPAIDPPWSTLTAYDLNAGKIKWQIPYGGVSNLEAKGISNTGSYWPRGGVAVTAGGLRLCSAVANLTQVLFTCPAAVHIKGLARKVGRFVRSQKCCHRTDFVRLPWTPHGNLRQYSG
jgi:hypothetical protein